MPQYAPMVIKGRGGQAPTRPQQTTYAPGKDASARLDPSYIGAISRASDTALGGMKQLGDALGNAGKAFGAIADMYGRGDALRRYRGYMADLDDALYNKDSGLISSTKGESAFDIERAVQAKQEELRGKWLDGSSRLLGVPAYFDMMAYDYDRKTYGQGVQHSASEFNRWMPQQYGAMADVFMQKAQASAGDPIASQRYFEAALGMTEQGMRFNGAGDAEVLRQFQRMDHDWVSGQIGALCDQGRWDEAQALLTGGRFARVDMGARLPGGGTLGGSYSNQVETLTRQWNGKAYSMDGPRDPNRGSTDCSGLVSHALLAMSQGPNAIFDEATARKMIGGGTSDAIVQNIASLSGRPLMGREQLTPDRVQPGTVIGLDTGRRGWDADHWNGIDHVVMTFEKDGAPWIFESAGGKGVRSLPYERWFAETLKNHPDAVFYGTNALALSRAPQGGATEAGTQPGQPAQEAGTTAGTEAEQPAAGEGTPPPPAGGTTPGAAGGATGTTRAASTAGDIEPMPQNFNSALSYGEAARAWSRIQAGKRGQQMAAQKEAIEAQKQAEEQHKVDVRNTAMQWLDSTRQSGSEEEREAALDNLLAVLSPEDRKVAEKAIDEQLTFERRWQKSQDTQKMQQYVNVLKAQGRGQVYADQLLATSGLSAEDREKIKDRAFGRIEEGPGNRQALRSVLRAIDNGDVTSDEEIEYIGYDRRLTDAQIKQAQRYLETGGNSAGLKEKDCENIWRDVAKKRKGAEMPDGVYEMALEFLPKGKVPTDQEKRRAVQRAILDGHLLTNSDEYSGAIDRASQGFWATSYTPTEAQAKGQLGRWVPHVNDDESAEIRGYLVANDERWRGKKPSEIPDAVVARFMLDHLDYFLDRRKS